MSLELLKARCTIIGMGCKNPFQLLQAMMFLYMVECYLGASVLWRRCLSQGTVHLPVVLYGRPARKQGHEKHNKKRQCMVCGATERNNAQRLRQDSLESKVHILHVIQVSAQ